MNVFTTASLRRPCLILEPKHFAKLSLVPLRKRARQAVLRVASDLLQATNWFQTKKAVLPHLCAPATNIFRQQQLMIRSSTKQQPHMLRGTTLVKLLLLLMLLVPPLVAGHAGAAAHEDNIKGRSQFV